jgi:hypothetical protein
MFKENLLRNHLSTQLKCLDNDLYYLIELEMFQYKETIIYFKVDIDGEITPYVKFVFIPIDEIEAAIATIKKFKKIFANMRDYINFF